MVTPVAFIAIRGNEISFHGIKKGGGLEALWEQLPEIAATILARPGASAATEP